MESYTTYESPIGLMYALADDDALTGLWFDGQKHFDRGALFMKEQTPLPIFSELQRWLDIYFSGEIPDFTLPLSPDGSEFQKLVWAELLKIPYGLTLSYGELAKRLGCKSAQAVGGAVGRNPISVIIPCHRVLGADGSLTGYDGGLDKKLWLLRNEGVSKSPCSTKRITINEGLGAWGF